MTSTIEPAVSSESRSHPRGRTLRTDRWWAMPTVYAGVLTAFVVYSTYAVIIGTHFSVSAGGRHYISPFYSPCLAEGCGTFTTPLLGGAFGTMFLLSRIVILLGPLGFRTTCYYYRKVGYRSLWASPPACAVTEPHRRYTGERRFPLVAMNTHRYWWYVAMAFCVMLGYDAYLGFRFGSGYGMGVGSLLLAVNALLVTLYTVSCHSCRHIMGGRLNHFSRHPVRYRLWTWVSTLNARHGSFAMASLTTLALTDLYIRLVSAGAIADPRFF